MRRNGRMTVVLASLACVLGVFACWGCGGTAASEAPADEAKQEQSAEKEESSKQEESTEQGKKDAQDQEESAKTAEKDEPSDEEQIETNLKQILGAATSKDMMLQGLRSDEEMVAAEEMGLDLEAYTENMANLFQVEVASVKVDDEEAVATVNFTVPNFNEAADALVDKAVESAVSEADVQNMSDDELMAFYMNIVSTVLADPQFPTETKSFDVDYVKKSGFWTMKDPTQVQSTLQEIMGSASTVEEAQEDE